MILGPFQLIAADAVFLQQFDFSFDGPQVGRDVAGFNHGVNDLDPALQVGIDEGTDRIGQALLFPDALKQAGTHS